MTSENSILGHYDITKLGLGSYGFAASKFRARSLGGVAFHVMYLQIHTIVWPVCMHPENLNTAAFSFVVTRKQRDTYKRKKGEILSMWKTKSLTHSSSPATHRDSLSQRGKCPSQAGHIQPTNMCLLYSCLMLEAFLIFLRRMGVLKLLSSDLRKNRTLLEEKCQSYSHKGF